MLDGPHMMPLEHPVEFGAAIAEHLRWVADALSVTRLPLLPRRPPTRSPPRSSRPSRAKGRDPIALYRVLAHSPLMLRAYAGLARGLRYEAQTPRALRELMILRTAQLTASRLRVGAPPRDGGRTPASPDEKVRALAQWRDERRSSTSASAPRCGASRGSMTIALSDEAFAALERAVGAAATSSSCCSPSFYEAVARMIQAFGLEVEPAYQPYLRPARRSRKESAQ